MSRRPRTPRRCWCYDLPTVHVPVAYFTAVTTEARRAGGTAAFAGSQLIPGVPAPVMNASSSRGPNRADPDVLKPDITAPGTDIIAAFANQSITPAQREQIIAGTLVPGPWADMISGTSMSSPHVAGAAALLRQANPTWSPFAIKSALMTSATQNVKLADGTPDLNRWGFGSGHLNPNGALATKVVYDSDFVEYIRYYNGQINGRALNLPSLTFANIVGSGTLTRKLTNRGTSTETFTGSASAPGFSVSLSPASLTLAPGETKSFSVRLARNGSPIGAYAFGEVVWTGAGGQSLRSPLTAKAESLVALSSVSDTRNVGTKVFTVATGYDGPFASAATGLVPAKRLPGSVALDDQACFGFKVPAGAKQLRLQMFNSETQGGAASDLDLEVYRGTTLVGSSGGASSDELVSLSNPAAADYVACVIGYAPVNGEATFTLNQWVVGPTVSPATLRAAGPSTVYTGGVASVAMAWDVPAGARYLGVVEYRTPPGAAVIGRTTVFIDNVAAKGVASKMIVSRDKNVR